MSAALVLPAPFCLDVGDLDWEALSAARENVMAIRAAMLGPPAHLVLERPRRALTDYRANRHASEVSRILAAASHLRDSVDRVVIVAGAGTQATVRALVQACTHPYHNELSRGARGMRPRLYFAGADLDNDALHGLLELLSQGAGSAGAWGLIAIDPGEDACAPLAVLRLLGARLLEAVGGNRQIAADRLLVVSPAGSRFDVLARPCHQTFALADGLPGAWSLFTAAALLPAAVLGIDIVRFLVGGTAATSSFCKGNADPAIELAAVRHLLAAQGARRRTLATSLRALQGFRSWHDEGLVPTITTPASVVASGGPSIQLVVTAAQGRCDGVGIDPTPTPARGQRSISLRLPRLDEATLGEFAQALLLATIVENQLSGFNSEL